LEDGVGKDEEVDRFLDSEVDRFLHSEVDRFLHSEVERFFAYLSLVDDYVQLFFLGDWPVILPFDPLNFF
jgi:hypothetical protein